MTPSVLVTLPLPPDHLAPLDGLAALLMPDPTGSFMPRAEILEKIGACQGLITFGETRVDGALLAAAPNLRVVANVAMGIDNFDLPTLTSRGIWATNTPDAFAESTADCTLALILAVTRNVVSGDRFVRSGDWATKSVHPAFWEGTLLGGKTLGLVGYGRIAKAVEKRALAFGMRVLFNRSHADPSPNYRPLDTLLAESDIVSLHTPLTEATRHLLHAGAFARMKPGAVLINMARGKVVDEAALVAALQSGHLGGAGLDVFEEEPKVHPALIEMQNVVLTPHFAGSTREERRNGRLQAAENVARVLRGETPVTPVNQPEA